jgi:1,4-alpha-glucan branching enzyme
MGPGAAEPSGVMENTVAAADGGERILNMKENTPQPSKLLRTQTFRFAAPEAMSVMLVGDFTHWQKRGIPMHKDGSGTWTANVNLAPGKHSYRFIVDGEWRDDPECKLRVPNAFGSQDMIREAA